MQTPNHLVTKEMHINKTAFTKLQNMKKKERYIDEKALFSFIQMYKLQTKWTSQREIIPHVIFPFVKQIVIDFWIALKI